MIIVVVVCLGIAGVVTLLMAFTAIQAMQGEMDAEAREGRVKDALMDARAQRDREAKWRAELFEDLKKSEKTYEEKIQVLEDENRELSQLVDHWKSIAAFNCKSYWKLKGRISHAMEVLAGNKEGNNDVGRTDQSAAEGAQADGAGSSAAVEPEPGISLGSRVGQEEAERAEPPEHHEGPWPVDGLCDGGTGACGRA